MIEIPAKIITFLKQLEANGHEAYIVGGAVRDLQMGIEPKDWDIATSAVPGQIKETFQYIADVKQIDASFPVVVVDGVEIATYRTDVYHNGVTVDTHYSNNIIDDLGRRDLTINAMAMDKDGHLVDPYAGMLDIENQIIRFVGDPVIRIQEDPNRMIRASRFLALLEGEFEFETYIALLNAALYGNHEIAPERIRMEILKAMTYPKASKFFIGLYKTELLGKIFPTLAACYEADHGQYHDEDIFTHMMLAGDAIKKGHNKLVSFRPTAEMVPETFALLRLVGYLHDVGKSQPNFKDDEIHFYDHEIKGAEILKNELKALKFSTAEIKYITNMVLVHMRGSAKMSPKSTRKLIKKFVDLDVNWEHWLILKAADRIANIRRQQDQPLKVVKIAKKFMHELEDIAYEKGPREANVRPAFEHKQLAISGTTIREVLGIGPSQFVGVALDYLLNRVIDNPALNTREELIYLLTGRREK